MFGCDYDSDEYGYDNGYGDYDYGFRGNPHDDYAFYMHMQGIHDDSYDSYNSYDSQDSLDSQGSRKSWKSEYFNWEETRMRDSHLLHFKALVPEIVELRFMREEARITSMAGGEWNTIAEMENEGGGGWLESKGVVRYQDVYNLAGNLVTLLTAWRVRMKQCQVEWNKDQITKLLKIREVTRSEALGGDEVVEFGEEGPEDYNTGLCWWMSQLLGTQEIDLSVEDRMGYSVGRGMVVFGTGESFEQLVKEVIGVKNLARSFVMGVLAENLPAPLPYPTLLSLSKIILSSGGATNLGWSSGFRASQLVESRYVNRLYLAILDIYNVIREVMFKHAAETASPSFPTKFSFMRSTLARNLSLLQSFHQLTKHEEPQTGSIFCKGLKELQFKFESSSRSDIVLHDRNFRNRMVVSEGHVFIVQTCRRAGDGLVVTVHDLETGEVVKEFTAIPLSLLSGNKYTLSTQVCVEGDLMVISLSHGYHKITSVSSYDLVFVINWVQEKLVMSKTVPHSPQFKAAVSKMSQLDSDEYSGDNDSLNSSFYDEEIIGVNSSLGVFLTEKSGSVFLLHREVVLPDSDNKAELDKWGQHVRIWRLQEDRIMQELHDVRILDLQAALLIYEEADDGRSNHNKKGSFTQLNDIDVKVKWLDLESGKELFQESFVDTKQTPRPVHSIATLSESGTVVVQHQPGQDSIHIYDVSEAGLVSTSQEVVFPALSSVGYRRADDLKMRLITKDLLSFSHSMTSPSLANSFPVKGTRCVLARAGSVNVLGEMFVPNTMESEAISRLTRTNVFYLVNPADRILQEGTRLVLMREEKHTLECEITVTLQQYEFQKPALEVIKSDDDVAKEILQNKGTAREQAVGSDLPKDLSDLVDSDISSYESSTDDDELPSIVSGRTIRRPSDRSDASPVAKVLSTPPPLANHTELAATSTTSEGGRVKGSLVKWCGSFGFLKLVDQPDASNVFIHINEISKPRPLLTAGTRLEVGLVEDLDRNRVKGVAGRMLD